MTTAARTERSACADGADGADVAIGAWVRPLVSPGHQMRWHLVAAHTNGGLTLACGGRVAASDIDASATQGLAPALRDRCPRCEIASDGDRSGLDHLFDGGDLGGES